jgi:hypothetical protein
VSVFRPSVRLTAADGREWEIYTYKLELRERAEGDDHVVNRLVRVAVLIPRLVVRLVDAGLAAARAARSDAWTIEAITFMPHRQSYTWKTTSEYRGQVLAQIEGSLQRGDVPQHLRNATYVGWRRSAR